MIEIRLSKILCKFCYCSFRFKFTINYNNESICFCPFFFFGDVWLKLIKLCFRLSFLPCFSLLFVALHFSQASIVHSKNCNIKKILFSATVVPILGGENKRILPRWLWLQLGHRALNSNPSPVLYKLFLCSIQNFKDSLINTNMVM